MKVQKQLTCEERIDAHLSSRLSDLRVMLEPSQDDVEFDSWPCFLMLGEGGCDMSPTEQEAFRDGDLSKEESLEMYWDELCQQARDRWYEYGLSFDYVPASDRISDSDRLTTRESLGQGYFRYQLSTGGPGDEFRFFADYGGRLYRVEYWFLDWFDGVHRVLAGDDLRLLASIWDELVETGTVEAVYRKATED